MPTPIYGLRFPGLGDAPHGPDQIQHLAEDVEATLLTKADKSTNSNVPVEVDEQTLLGSQANTTFAAGSPVCGTTFVAPDSGKVFITVSGEIRGNASNAFARLGYEVRAGSVIGSGTVQTAAADNRSVVAGAVATGVTDFRVGASRETLVTGLTPGSTYNVRTMHKTNTGTFNVYSRELLIKMVH
jgi:hypothetical protein